MVQSVDWCRWFMYSWTRISDLVAFKKECFACTLLPSFFILFLLCGWPTVLEGDNNLIEIENSYYIKWWAGLYGCKEGGAVSFWEAVQAINIYMSHDVLLVHWWGYILHLFIEWGLILHNEILYNGCYAILFVRACLLNPQQ